MIKTLQHETALQLCTCEIELEFPALIVRASLFVAIARRPCTKIPNHDGAATVFVLGNHTFELEIVERMIFNVNRKSLIFPVERRAFRYSPAQKHTVEL